MSRNRAAAGDAARHYRLVHSATYTYPAPVTGSYARAILLPREGGGQVVHSSRLDADPTAAETAEHRDFHGNRSTYLRIGTEHSVLRVRAESVLTVTRRAVAPDRLPTVPWTRAAEVTRTLGAPGRGGADGHGLQGAALLGVAEARLPSDLVELDEEVRDLAAPSFGPGSSLAHSVVDLAQRIHRLGRAGATDVAHLMIAAVRSMGLAARFVSGYLATDDGRADGAVVHSWVSVWVPGGGWLHVDPTTGDAVDGRYIVLGWGRDYLDVSPLRGVVYAVGSGTDVDVAVALEELSDADVAAVRAARPPRGRPDAARA